MKFGICILFLLVLFMLAGVIPVSEGAQTVIFRTPVFIVLLVLLAISLLVCLFKRKPKLPFLGFHLSHLGALLILIGGGISYMKEVRVSFPLYVDEESIVRELPLKNRKFMDLGFGLTLKDFDVSRYKPDFALYKPETVQKVRISPRGILDIGPSGRFRVKQLFEKGKPPRYTVYLVSETNEEVVLVEGSLAEQHTLKDGYVLKLLKPVDRQYSAVLRFTADDNSTVEREMSMNKPVDFKGWRFYLNSYDPQLLSYVMVTARRDPGRKIVIIGIFALMIGVAMKFYSGDTSG